MYVKNLKHFLKCLRVFTEKNLFIISNGFSLNNNNWTVDLLSFL